MRSTPKSTNKKIYISGMHSGQNPCSGVGIARCLKKAFPEITIVGADHWQGASGLHDVAVDETLLLPQWKQIDDERHSKQVRSILDDGHLWIASMDMEVHWFAENLGRHRNLLAPSGTAIERTAKPAVPALEGLDFKVPDFIPAHLPDSEIHSFLRHNSWQCWLKSPYHDAQRITSWSVFERARATMSKSWRTSKLFLQRHVSGNEETIAFCADQGDLVGCVQMQKRQITPEGKTWAAHVTDVDPAFQERFKEHLRRLEWSGGGEVEYVRDPDGQKWIIECNPRFPAWIYGAALNGRNIPARLISKIWDLPLLESQSRYQFFTRVVQEIPAKEAVGIPLPPDPSTIVWSTDGKKGKGGSTPLALQPNLKASDDEDEEDITDLSIPETLPATYANEVSEIAARFQGETPARIHLERWTESRFLSLARKVQECRSRRPEVRIGYSVKTSPTDEHLRKAKAHGFFAECISQAEVRRAINFGFSPEEVILNGPGKFWPLTTAPVNGLHMVFCDSVEEYERVLKAPEMSQVLGFRMRLPKVPSRFGNALDDFDNFQRIIEAVRKLKNQRELGFHFHMPSWAIGVQRWTEALHSLFAWCQTIQQLTGIPVRHLDMGGGFFPTDLESLDLKKVQGLVNSALPEVQSIYFEPGRSLTQDGEILVSRVLDVRRGPKSEEPLDLVVDACVAELPFALAYTHRIFHKSAMSNPACNYLRKGHTRVLGRICMEDDILSAGLDFPEDVQIGDLVIFGDAGGYERTMSYVFGRG